MVFKNKSFQYYEEFLEISFIRYEAYICITFVLMYIKTKGYNTTFGHVFIPRFC